MSAEAGVGDEGKAKGLAWQHGSAIQLNSFKEMHFSPAQSTTYQSSYREGLRRGRGKEGEKWGERRDYIGGNAYIGAHSLSTNHGRPQGRQACMQLVLSLIPGTKGDSKPALAWVCVGS